MFHSKITYLFPHKAHEWALKLTDFVDYEFIVLIKINIIIFVNGSFAF